MRELADFLSDDYCARCDSFGHTERKDHPHLLWCNVCWDWAKPISYTLRKAIERALA